MAAILIVNMEQTSALAILKFDVPKPGVPVAAGQRLALTGTSMEPNATATNCNVQLQTNQNGYKPTTPTGPLGPNKYVNWTGQSDPLQAGLNHIEAQLTCFAPSVNPAASNPPSLLKHIVHNVTAVASVPSLGSQPGSSAAAPPAGIQPPPMTKFRTCYNSRCLP
jgi:hypothetical protein